jgi:hypothetical protein
MLSALLGFSWCSFVGLESFLNTLGFSWSSLGALLGLSRGLLAKARQNLCIVCVCLMLSIRFVQSTVEGSAESVNPYAIYTFISMPKHVWAWRVVRRTLMLSTPLFRCQNTCGLGVSCAVPLCYLYPFPKAKKNMFLPEAVFAFELLPYAIYTVVASPRCTHARR